MKKIILVLTFLLVISFTNYAMTETQWNFAQDILALAYEAKKVTGLPASITVAIVILETGYGKHLPIDIYTGEKSNNFFGIKAFGSQPYVTCFTYEYYTHEYIKVLAKFRKYDTFLESLIDYGNLILNSKRYEKAAAVKDNPIKYIQAIWEAGYATSPDYVQKIINIAEICEFLTENKWEK